VRVHNFREFLLSAGYESYDVAGDTYTFSFLLLEVQLRFQTFL
jgi:hypothetical protein